eukprot:455218_1
MSLVTRKCANCAKEGVSKHCSACKKTFYCNEKCQAVHWKKHKRNCKLISLNLKQNANNNFIEANYLQRINLLLNMYSDIVHKQQNSNNETSKNNIYSMVISQYPNNDITKFMKDYAQYVDNMDINRVYLATNKQQNCLASDCIAMQREYTDRNRERSELYFACSDNTEMAIVQMMDILHITKYHLIDMALRYKTQYHSDNIKTVVTQLKQKRNKFNHIRKDSASFTEVKNKFVTNIFEQGDEKQEEKGDKSQTYSLGFRFYYHEHYRNNCGEQEYVPGSTILDQTNYIIDSKYRYCDWFIKPKYNNIREEVLNAYGKEVTLSKEQF